MTASISSDEEFEVELQQRLDRVRRQRSESLPVRSLAWLALAPAWTETLAIDSHFPLEGLTLAQFLEQATAAQLCAQGTSGASSGFEIWHRARALAAIGSRLPAHRLPDLIKRLLDIQNTRIRVEALTLLLSNLPRESRAEVSGLALSEAEKIEDDLSRIESLMRIADYLPDEQKTEIMQQSLEESHSIESTTERTRVLVGVAPHLPENRLKEALKKFYSHKDWATSLSSLTPYVYRTISALQRSSDPERAARSESTTKSSDEISGLSQSECRAQAAL